MRRSTTFPLAFLGLACLVASARGDATDDRIRQQEAALKLRDAQIRSLRAKVAELEAQVEKLRPAQKEPGRPSASQPALAPAPADAEIRRKLDKTIERLSVNDFDLGDIIQMLREYSKADIQVNWRALKAAGIEQSKKVTLDVRNISVKRALDLILRDVSAGVGRAEAELRYVADGGVLTISTRSDLLMRPGRSGDPKPADDAEALLNGGRQSPRQAAGKQAAEGEIAKALVRSIQALAGAATQKDFDMAESAARLALETLFANKGFLNAEELAGHRARIEAQLRLIAIRRGASGGPEAADPGRPATGR